MTKLEALKISIKKNLEENGRCIFYFPFKKDYCFLLPDVCDYMGEVEQIDALPERKHFRTCKYFKENGYKVKW